MKYDFTSRQFVENGKPVTKDRFNELAKTFRVRTGRSGEASIRRAALLTSLVRSESRERPGLLENVLRRGAQLVSGGMVAYGPGGSGQELPGLRGAFSRADGQPLQPAITPAADQSDAAILNTELARYFNNPQWENAYAQVELPDDLRSVWKAFAGGFGRRIVQVASTAPRFDVFNGFRLPANPDVLYVSARANRNPVAIAGHELLHDLKERPPLFYKWLADMRSGRNGSPLTKDDT
jgi:hypothetical protein